MFKSTSKEYFSKKLQQELVRLCDAYGAPC